MTACFCPTIDLGESGGQYSYYGIHCDNGSTGPGIETYSSPKPLNPSVIDPCPCGGPDCPHPVGGGGGGLRAGLDFWTVYERGVPNPANPFSRPDDPMNTCTVIGDYLAEFKFAGQARRARLIHFGFPPRDPDRLLGVAFLVNKKSRPSPVWTPTFTQASGWVTVEDSSTTAAKATRRIWLVVRDLGRFELQIRRPGGVRK